GISAAGARLGLFPRLAADMSRRWPALAGGRGLATIAALYGLTMLGAAPAARALPHRAAVAELNTALPASLPLLPGAAAEAAVGDGFAAAVNLEGGLAY